MAMGKCGENERHPRQGKQADAGPQSPTQVSRKQGHSLSFNKRFAGEWDGFMRRCERRSSLAAPCESAGKVRMDGARMFPTCPGVRACLQLPRSWPLSPALWYMRRQRAVRPRWCDLRGPRQTPLVPPTPLSGMALPRW